MGAPTPRCQMGGGDRPLRGEDPPFGKDTWISRTANSGQESSCAHWPLQGRAVFLRPPATRRPRHEGSGATPLAVCFRGAGLPERTLGHGVEGRCPFQPLGRVPPPPPGAPAGPWPFSPVAALVGAPPSRPAALLRKLPVRGDPILDAVTCPPTEARTGTRLQGAGPSHGGRLAGCAREGPDPAGRSGRAGECRRRDPGPRAGAALGHARGPGGLSCG